MKRLLLICIVCLQAIILNSQTQNFTFYTEMGYHLQLEEVIIPSFPKFHSSAVGSYNGKWIIIGGRTNGLHGFYPPFAFPTNGIQNQLYVVDPDAGSVWNMGLDSLPQPLKEQFSSSNMQYCVNGDKLYISGGYGYSATLDDYITFPYLTEVDMNLLSQAVISGTNPSHCFKYTIDSAMAVTGGRMLEKDDRYYLFFGHKFTGRYSSTPGPDFEQEYSYQIRMFNIASSVDSIHITNYSTVTDSVNFRRRDLNVTPYVKHNNGNDTVGFMGWSGVFKANADRPFTDQIFIKPDGTYSIVETIQRYNQYHCAYIPMEYFGYRTHTVFFGGMAEYESNNGLVADTLVPFVKNVSMVAEDALSIYEELAYEQLDTFAGTNAEFVPLPNTVNESTGLVELYTEDCNVLLPIGYIIGGIESTGKHISTMNDPSLSLASDKVYKVSIAVHCWDVEEHNMSALQVFPNPSQDFIRVNTNENITHWQVMDISGKTMIDTKSNATKTLDVSSLQTGTYFVKIFTSGNLYRSTFIKI